ncbi:MAG: tRNA glutamyl-Q(34) synthetase GluQRS [Rhodospirillaceae bacterium TMED8]|nr:tRNA glutamyl-Q(34) synthetase GluQRS [Magnetovibrio sp.]OUT49854.1 MAG: tRNA glutamyl-Q(34) synthetase GluQRS [Rhodospirillaceae bacterium TMED8]|tara:strand:+ start:1809 stop:2675 length:867 start_codon:yes stop_codon:yes gene_type:complete
MFYTRTRFAPSPTGNLHLGHAYSALFAAREAQKSGINGQFLLRIEDIDFDRCRPEFEKIIYEDLQWLGLSWNEPVRRQSLHMSDYKNGIDHLSARGLLYPCFCTRKKIKAEVSSSVGAPHKIPSRPEGYIYPGICRNLDTNESADRIASGAAHALRLKIDLANAMVGKLTWHDNDAGEQTAHPEIFGDVVLARKEIPASYHLAVTLDDAIQKITLVTRGEDLFLATHLHRLLQALLDLPVPQYHHHKIITDEMGKRLAKRAHSMTIEAFRQGGRTPEDVRAIIGLQNN